MKERFYLLSLGCPKNSVDSEGMSQLLRRHGYTETAHPEEADILIVNTCGFIRPARQESVAALRELAAHKRRQQLLVAAGCLPEQGRHTLERLVPRLDGIIGTRHWTDIAAFLAALRARGGRSRSGACYAWEPAQSKADSLVATFPRRVVAGASAYIKIADGCDAACAFCTIPLIKGPQQSKPPAAIVAEARQLVAQGVREIILIAQDTTAYGRDLGMRDGLPDLIETILAAVPELTWLRLLYAYPQHITPRLIRLMAEREPICHYLDMPLQHSHPAVLRRMGRSPDMAGVRALIARLREAMPDIALRTTFIVGYPGETEAEFADLLAFLQEIAFDKVGVFPYSQEESTPAAALPDQVPEEIKQERYQRAMTLQQEISIARNREQIGRQMTVLIEGQGKGLSVGRSYRDAPEIDGLILVPGETATGEMVPVRITQALEYDLVGERQAL